MSISPIRKCAVCTLRLGATFEDRDDSTKHVTAILHKPDIGPAHEMHRFCAFQWFGQQLEQEPAGISPTDLENLPFSCPLCRKKLSLENAEEAAGVSLADMIKIERRFKQPHLQTTAPVRSYSFPCIAVGFAFAAILGYISHRLK